jgi:hypothetical protein
MVQILEEKQAWMIEIAAMLSQIGCAAIPEDILTRRYRGEDLPKHEAEAFAVHPLVGRDLLKNIPRLEGVAEIVGYQEKRFNGEGTPPDGRRGKSIPAGSRILKAALDFDALVSADIPQEMAIAEMYHRPGWYDPDVLSALRKAANVTRAHVIREMKADQLVDGMILANNIRSLQGTLLCAKGQEVNPALRVRLRNCICNLGIQGPIQVFVPVDFEEPNVLMRTASPVPPVLSSADEPEA